MNNKLYSLLGCACVAMIVLLYLASNEDIKYGINFSFNASPFKEPKPDNAQISILKIRKRISKILRQPLEHNLAVELVNINNILSTIASTEYEPLDNGSSDEDSTEVCPEKFIKPSPNEVEKWVLQNCTTNAKLEDLVTIVMNFVQIPGLEVKSTLKRILNEVSKSHQGISVIIGMTEVHDLHFLQGAIRVKIEKFASAEKPGKIWNKLISNVNTKYVLVLKDVTHFYGVDGRLSRMVRQAGKRDIDIIGGAVRNKTGHWSTTCKQMAFRYYELKFKHGYEFSRDECVFCDVITGPFLTKVKTFESNIFDESLPSELLFVDFFMRLKDKDLTTTVCPDAMFYVNSTDIPDASWRILAQKHLVTKLYLPNGAIKKYPCEDVGIKCEKIKSLAKPQCCLKTLANELRVLTQHFEDNDIPYQLDSGSVIGAVKMRSILPWDIDTDISYLKSDLKRIKDALANKKYNVVYYNGGKYFVRYIKDWFLEAFNDPVLDSNDLVKKGLPPTRLPVNQHWLIGPRNPGLYCRDRYGNEIYKHAEHWRDYQLKSSWFAYKPGKFLKCQKPSSSACLDTFQPDGNLQFFEPV